MKNIIYAFMILGIMATGPAMAATTLTDTLKPVDACLTVCGACCPMATTGSGVGIGDSSMELSPYYDGRKYKIVGNFYNTSGGCGTGQCTYFNITDIEEIPASSGVEQLPNFSSKSSTMHIPELTLDGQKNYYNVELILDFKSGQFRITRADSKADVPLKAALGTPFVLFMGQNATLQGTDIAVEFSHISDDSRCPADVVCVWEGEVTAKLHITQNNNTQEVNLTLSSRDTSLSVHESNGFRIELLSVEPYPQTSQPIAISAYEVKLLVSEIN